MAESDDFNAWIPSFDDVKNWSIAGSADDRHLVLEGNPHITFHVRVISQKLQTKDLHDDKERTSTIGEIRHHGLLKIEENILKLAEHNSGGMPIPRLAKLFTRLANVLREQA